MSWAATAGWSTIPRNPATSASGHAAANELMTSPPSTLVSVSVDGSDDGPPPVHAVASSRAAATPQPAARPLDRGDIDRTTSPPLLDERPHKPPAYPPRISGNRPTRTSPRRQRWLPETPGMVAR